MDGVWDDFPALGSGGCWMIIVILILLSSLKEITSATPSPVTPVSPSRHLLAGEQEYFVTVTSLVTGLSNPSGVSISPDGLYALVTNANNHLISHIVISTASVTTLAGVASSSGSTDGIGTMARFNSPIGISISPDGVYALVSDMNNQLIRHIIISTASVTTLAGFAGSVGSANGIGTNARFNNAHGISFSPDGVFALVAGHNDQQIRQIIISTASVTTLAGSSWGSHNGIGTNSRFKNPRGICISSDGAYALVADSYNDQIRRIILSNASVTAVAGVAGVFGSTDGLGSNSNFYKPFGISISPDGVYALVSDSWNHLIRRIVISTGLVTTVAGVAGSTGAANVLE